MGHPHYIPAAEVGDYFAASDLVILPYREFSGQTGVGMVALPLGKPLIVTETGGLPDLVQESPCVVRPNDPTALAEAICWSTETQERLKQLSSDSLRSAERLGWNSIALQTIEAYRKVLGSRKSPLAA